MRRTSQVSGEQPKPRAGPPPRGHPPRGYPEALEEAAAQMVATMPRMFKAIMHQARSAEAAGPSRDLGASQRWVLHTLTTGRHLSSELARRFNVTNPTMTRIVDGLVDKGYVERLPDPHDRRCTYLQLTAAGSEIGEQMHEQFHAALRSFLSPLTDEQLADIALAFRHLSSLLPEGERHGEMRAHWRADIEKEQQTNTNI